MTESMHLLFPRKTESADLRSFTEDSVRKSSSVRLPDV